MKSNIIFFLIFWLFLSCTKNEEKPSACFSYSHSYTFSMSPIPGPGITRDSVNFTNCSENATSYLWDFGDGSSSTEKNPIHVYTEQMPSVVKLTAFNGSNTDVLIDTIWEWAIVYKPNVYIYPEKEANLCVSLNFPKGGQIVSSIPDYNNSWCVNVEPSGKINNEFDFLFYESMQPNIWQKQEGWLIQSTQLSDFFKTNMQEYAFNSHEITDFIEYWIPKLNKYAYYAIYPQTKSIINRVIQLDFSKEPQNTNRLFYVIEGFEKPKELTQPKITPFNKTGFYVNEWGVVI